MQSTQTAHESLERARVLMRELIDRLQQDAPGGQTQTPASLMRILVHMVNIQKITGQASEYSGNAIKRLRDFANTIERIEPAGANAASTRDIQRQLVEVLRAAADQILGPAAADTWTAAAETAAAG